MRHILSTSVKTFVFCAGLTLITACDNFENIVLFKSVGDPKLFQSDVDFAFDRKNVDIEVDMSEELSINVLQATLFAYLDSPLYRYLDASEFPEEGSSICLNQGDESLGGSASFRSSKQAGEVHEKDDLIEIEYNNCQLSSGQVVSGSLSFEYTDVLGVNNKFSPVSTEYCVERLQEIDDKEEFDTLYLVGDELAFSPFGGNTKIDVYEYSYEEEQRIETLRSSHVVSERQRTLVINERLDAGDDDLTSLEGGEQVYLLYEGKARLQRCQYYRRAMDVEIEGFSVQDGAVRTTMNGSIEFYNDSEDLTIESFNISDSELEVIIEENDSRNVFELREFNALKTENPELGNYEIGFSGVVKSDAFGGLVELDALSDNFRLQGILGEYPKAGSFVIIGQGVERVTLTVQPQQLLVAVDYDGDTSVASRSFPDESFFTTWDQLIAREFLRDDFVVPE